MDLPKELRSEIADQIIRIVAPVAFFVTLLNGLGVLLVGGQQYQRLIPTVFGVFLIAPSWVFARKGKPLIGIIFLLTCFCLGGISGMVVSGGIHALSYTSTLVIITVFVILFGARGGILFAVSTVVLGSVFSLLMRHGILHPVDAPTTSYLFLVHTSLLATQLVFVLVPVRLMHKALKASQNQRTELQQAVIERKEVQDELTSILNNTTDIIYRLDPEGRITFVNERVRKYGYSPENIVGKTIMEFIHPDDWPSASPKILERRSRNRSENNVEANNVEANNVEARWSAFTPGSENQLEQATSKKWIPFLISSKGLYSEDTVSPKSFIGVQGLARDISEIKHFEGQVDRLAAVVEQAAEDVVITDSQGTILYVNPRFQEVTGYTSSEVLGETPRLFKSGKQDAAFYAKLWNTITRGEIWKGHIWNRIKNGSLILQDVTIAPIFDAGDKLTGYASVRRDITEESRTRQQLQQTQKMEAIGTLAGGIAHDFNNILQGMIGYTQLALDEVQDRPSTKEELEQVLKAGRRAIDLVKQILSFSRSQKTEARPIKPAMIAKEVVKLIRASLPSTIEIKDSIRSKRNILADPTNIHQVLMNLCTNAGHAMKQKGGVLSISLQDVMLGQDDLSHRSDALPGEYLKISVEDTGTGMTKDTQEKAFDPFFTTKEQGEGTGMGLSTVHGIITELGGFISLYSELNKGTAIHIFIPLISDTAEIETAPSDEFLRGGTERILFVDDEQIQIDLTKEVLSRYGYRVTAFSDSTIALAHFQHNPYEYDLVITDMTMPKLTGDFLTHKIHLVRPDIPVIMCTGFSEHIDEQKAMALDINALLYKPVIKAELLGTIRDVLDKNRKKKT